MGHSCCKAAPRHWPLSLHDLHSWPFPCTVLSRCIVCGPRRQWMQVDGFLSLLRLTSHLSSSALIAPLLVRLSSLQASKAAGADPRLKGPKLLSRSPSLSNSSICPDPEPAPGVLPRSTWMAGNRDGPSPIPSVATAHVRATALAPCDMASCMVACGR